MKAGEVSKPDLVQLLLRRRKTLVDFFKSRNFQSHQEIEELPNEFTVSGDTIGILMVMFDEKVGTHTTLEPLKEGVEDEVAQEKTHTHECEDQCEDEHVAFDELGEGETQERMDTEGADEDGDGDVVQQKYKTRSRRRKVGSGST